MATIFLCAALNSCSPDDDDVATPSGPGGTPGTGIPTEDHTRFTLNGTQTTYLVSGTYLQAAFRSVQGDGDLHQEYQGSTLMNVAVEPPMVLYWAMLKAFPGVESGFSPTAEQMNAMVTVGPKTFGRSMDAVPTAEIQDGVVVCYIDPDGVPWSTDRGTGDQTGSTFSVVSKNAVASPYHQTEVLATFSCKLYNEAGAMMTLTNGSMRSPCVTWP